MQPFRNVGALALLAATMLPAAFAQYASPVKVTNAGDSPVPTRDTRQTVSAMVPIFLGESIVSQFFYVPTCTGGTDFLVTSITAAPNINFNLPTGPWGVQLDLVQKNSNGADSRPLMAFATGPQTASTTLPAGQPAGTPGITTITLHLLGNPAPGEIVFIVHVSGYCGVAFVSPVSQ